MIKIKTPVIYAYKKKSSGKIVYVGQTIDISTRHKAHVKYDPYNPRIREYDYPLSRGIRKYGEEEYELLILEKDVEISKLNEREKHYIALYDTYQNGYNQNIGGGHNVNFYRYSDEVIDMTIELLKDCSYSLAEIVRITGLSMTHIYNINTGARRRRDGLLYPIRSEEAFTKGRRLSDKDIRELYDLLAKTNIPMSELAVLYNTQNISAINLGKQHRIDGFSYPLRKQGRSEASIEWVKNLLRTTRLTYREIEAMTGVKSSIVYNINSGKSYKNINEEYPIRKTGK